MYGNAAKQLPDADSSNASPALIIFIARKNDSGAPHLLERGTIQPGPGGWHLGRRRDVAQRPGRAAGGEATPPSARSKTRPDRGGSDRPDRVLPAGLGLVAAPDGRTPLPGGPSWPTNRRSFLRPRERC